MLTYQDIKNLCKEKGIAVTKMERDLGFAKGSLCKIDKSKPSMEKVKKISEYLDIPISQLVDSETDGYYFNKETAQVAQEIFENKDLKALFDATRDADPEDLRALHNMALALKRKERGNIDDTGC